eukprot:TRINITY_DN6526_c0_g1_i1.p1 TRINITY_DN6526_c0_g1~~TRINITY_DN6526_c0_g1_i1.p1  ORF type:complete len:680 (-),score=167.29 TRINITY_DN6526_c0_g1_i1:3-2042(-)
MASENVAPIHSYTELMTPQEEQELEKLLNSCVNGVTDIDELANHLSNKMVQYEVENISGLIDSEMAVKDVINRLDEASEQLTAIENWLNDYNSQLKNLRQSIEHIEAKNNHMEVVTRNQKILLEKVEKLLAKFSIRESQRKILMDKNYDIGSNVSASIDAATALQEVFGDWEALSDQVKQMQAIKEKIEEFGTLRDNFAAKLIQYIQDSFIRLASEEKNKLNKEEVNFRDHSAIHNSLASQAGLVHWLLKMDKAKYDSTLKSYSSSMRDVYRKEIKYYFETMSHTIQKDHKDQNRGILAVGRNRDSLPVSPSSSPAISKPKEKMPIDKVTTFILKSSLPAIMKEEKFCSVFFQMNIFEAETTPNQAMAQLLNELFDGFVAEITEILEQADKMDHFYLLSILGDLETFQQQYKTKSPFGTFVLSSMDKVIKKLFNKFIDEQVNQIKSLQVSIKKCGLVACIGKFPSFVDEMEERVGKNDNSRNLVDGAYNKIVIAMFTWLNQLGDTQQDQKKYKYILRIENFFYFAKQVPSRNVPCLGIYEQQAEEYYQKNLNDFVKLVINKRFKDLTAFFDGIDHLLETLPAEEIQFQQSHSKQSLAKLTSKSTPTSIEKQLKRLQKQVTENFCQTDELNVIHQVWEALTDYLLKRYQHFENLVKKCYKNQQLPVSNQELLSIIKTVNA